MRQIARNHSFDATCARASEAPFVGRPPRTLWRRLPCTSAPSPIGACPKMIPRAAPGRSGMDAKRA